MNFKFTVLQQTHNYFTFYTVQHMSVWDTSHTVSV